ncbi:MAG: YkgJ family cysteine cluster protein [Paludibaculum sp.]
MDPDRAAAGLIQIVTQTMDEAVHRGGAWVVCRPGCAECCLGVFSISTSDAHRLQQGLAELTTNDPSRAGRVRQRARLALTASGDDDPCPALDPDTLTCDLYAHRPVPCRTFGPALRFPEGEIRCCELCYTTATPEQIATAAVPISEPHLAELEIEETTVAEALAR